MTSSNLWFFFEEEMTYMQIYATECLGDVTQWYSVVGLVVAIGFYIISFNPKQNVVKHIIYE